MIETIFYFPESLAKYLENLNNLSSRTITFVPPTVEGGTGTIYKGGYPYGKMTKADIQQMITTIFNESGDYVLPIASADKLGGVKIGSGLNINNVTGVLTVDFGSVNSKTSLLESELAALSASVTVNTNAITSLDGRLSQAEASILTKASASDLTSATNRIGELETRTTSLLSLASIFANSIANLDDRISSAEAGLLVKANASEVTNLSNSLDSLRNTVTTLSGNAGLNASAYTDLERRIAEAETAINAKASASDVTTLLTNLGTITTKVTTLEGSSTTWNNAIADLQNRMSGAEAGIAARATLANTYSKTEVDGLITGVEQEIVAAGGFTTVAQILAADDQNKIVTVDSTMYSSITNDITDLQTGLSTLQTSYAGINAHTTLTDASLTLKAYSDGNSMYDGSKMVMKSDGDVEFYIRDSQVSGSPEYKMCVIGENGVHTDALESNLGLFHSISVREGLDLFGAAGTSSPGRISLTPLSSNIYCYQTEDDSTATDYITGQTGLYAGDYGTLLNGFGVKTARVILTESTNAIFVASGNSWYKGVTGTYGGLYFINGICVGTGTQLSDITAVSLMDIEPAHNASNS